MTALASFSWFYHSILAPCYENIAMIHQNKRDISSLIDEAVLTSLKPIDPLKVFFTIHQPHVGTPDLQLLDLPLTATTHISGPS
jgi:hypothetical protein